MSSAPEPGTEARAVKGARAAAAHRALVAVIAVSLAAKLLLFAVVASRGAEHFISIDTPSYDGPARSLVELGRFAVSPGQPERPESIRTPGYPLFLASFYATFGARPEPVILAHVLLTALSQWLVYLLAVRLGARRAVGVLAAAILGADIATTNLAMSVLTETLFTTLVLAAALAMTAGLESPGRLRPWLLCGLALAVAAHVRPVGYYLAAVPLAALAWQVLRERTHRPPAIAAKCAAALLAPIVLLVGGWQVRNAVVAGEPVFTHITCRSLLLYRAAGVVAFRDGTGFFDAQKAVTAGLPDVTGWPEKQISELYTAEALRILKAHPGTYARVFAFGWAKMLTDPADYELLALLGVHYPQTGPLGDLLRLDARAWSAKWIRTHAALLACFVVAAGIVYCVYVAAVLGFVRRREAFTAGTAVHMALGLLILYLMVLSAGPEAYARFRVPFAPLLALYAAAGIATARRVRTVLDGTTRPQTPRGEANQSPQRLRHMAGPRAG